MKYNTRKEIISNCEYLVTSGKRFNYPIEYSLVRCKDNTLLLTMRVYESTDDKVITSLPIKQIETFFENSLNSIQYSNKEKKVYALFVETFDNIPLDDTEKSVSKEVQ